MGRRLLLAVAAMVAWAPSADARALAPGHDDVGLWGVRSAAALQSRRRQPDEFGPPISNAQDELVTDSPSLADDELALGEGPGEINIVTSRDDLDTMSVHNGSAPAMEFQPQPDAFLAVSHAAARRVKEEGFRRGFGSVWQWWRPNPLPRMPMLRSAVVVGPVLVVYVTYRETRPNKTLDDVRSMFFDVPGIADALKFNAWGRNILTPDDVDFYELEVISSPELWQDLPAARSAVSQEPAIKNIMARRAYRRVLIIQPGDEYIASAYMPGSWSTYAGAAITWRTIMHELSHNFGISHAGGLSASGVFEQYQDDAISECTLPSQAPSYADLLLPDLWPPIPILIWHCA